MESIAEKIRKIIDQSKESGILLTNHRLRKIAESTPSLMSFCDKFDMYLDHSERMSQFYVKDGNDPQRRALYAVLYQTTINCARNMQMAAVCNERQAFVAARKRASGVQISEVPQLLENFGKEHTNMKYGSSSGENFTVSIEERKEYDAFCNRIFSVVLSSDNWTKSESNAMTDAITMPALNYDVSAMLASAITLSCMVVFDMAKFTCLQQIYDKTSNIVVQQRAFVGLVLLMAMQETRGFDTDSIDDPKKNSEAKFEMHWELSNVLSYANQLANSEDGRSALLSLQKQFVRQMKTRNISNEMKFQLLPSIMEAAKEVKTNLPTDIDESSIEDIIAKDFEERIGEKIQEKVGIIMNYKKEGMDIDYHSFSQIDSSAFYHTLSHWFMPFRIDHPDLDSFAQNIGEDHLKYFGIICKMNNFCNIDSYNFLFSLQKTFGNSRRVLEQVRKLAPPLDDIAHFSEEKLDVEAVRMGYIRDLYRFFNLSPMRNDFVEIFREDGKNGKQKVEYFLARPAFTGETFDALRMSVGRFLAKKKFYENISDFNVGDTFQKTEEGRILKALYEIHVTHEYSNAIQLLTPIALIHPDKSSVVRLLAQCCQDAEKYDDALHWYQSLPEEQKSNPSVKYQIVNCLLQEGKAKEAVNGAYELVYLYPDIPQYKDLLVEVLIKTGDPYKAKAEAKELLAWHQSHRIDPSVTEFMHVVECLWLTGSPQKAFMVLNGDLGRILTSEEIKVLLDKEKPILLSQGLGIDEFYIMRDLVLYRSEKGNK